MKNTKRDENDPVTDTSHHDNTTTPSTALSPAAQDEIGRRLRGVYGQMTSEPLPDKFTKLLEQLSKSEIKKPGKEQ